MPVPSNTDWTTAIDLGSLPASVNQIVNDGATSYTVWYKLTAAAGENIVGVWAYNPTLVDYAPRVHIFTVPAGTPVALVADLNIQGTSFVNVPMQFPVVPGTTYYIELEKNGNFNPSEIQLEVEYGPDPATDIVNGAILVPDDTTGLPGAVISAVDGDDNNIIRFIYPLVAGEFGDILRSSGRVLLEDKDNETLRLYDGVPSLAQLAAISFGDSNRGCFVRANQTTNKFWCGILTAAPTNADITSIDNDGNQGAVITLTGAGGLTALVTNPDDTIIFCSGIGGTSAIKQWNIAGASFDADLVAAVASYVVRDMLMLDDELLVLYFKDTNPRDLMARLYNSTTGALITQYDIDNGSDLRSLSSIAFGYRLAYAIDNPTTFWVWSHLFTIDGHAFSRFRNIRVSDETVLATVDYTEFEVGFYQGDQTLTPFSRFGISQSCPFIILQVVGGSGGIYKIVPGKRNDTLWVDVSQETTEDVKIPDPTIQTGLLGG